MSLKIRNPKSEVRKKSEVRSPKIPASKAGRQETFPSNPWIELRISDFELLSDFGFRVSEFN